MTDFEYEIKDLEAMSFAKNYHEWIVSRFRNFFGKKVAEIGAGSGSLSELLLKESIEELVAVEPDKNAYNLLLKEVGGDRRVKPQNNFFDSTSGYLNYFDSIVYVNVLEHVENEMRELENVRQALKPGGNVLIFVPALSFLYSDHDRHIGHFRRYHKNYLKNILEKSGFETVKIHYFDILGIVPWFVVYKVLKREVKPGNISFYDKLVVPVSRFLESIITPPVGKNLLAIGRKKS